MLTAEIKINGVIISVITLKNTGVGVGDAIVYGLEAYIPDDEYAEGELITSSVSHNPKDGAIVLVQTAINRVLEKREDNSK